MRGLGAGGSGPTPSRHSLTLGPTGGETKEEPDEEPPKTWGDELLRPAPPDILRIGGLNINGFPVAVCQSRRCGCKNCRLRAYLQENRFDIIGLSECNLHWPSLPIQAQLRERTRGWFESLHMSTAFLQRPTSASHTESQLQGPQQYGGTSVWSIGKASHRVSKSGSDPSGLGRWSWTFFQGCHGIRLRVIAAYCPVENKTGPTSVWNQQRASLDIANDDRTPTLAFTEDLTKELATWMENGEQIVLTMDVNNDVRNCALSQTFGRVGLVEIITDQHADKGIPPATYNRGTRPIDGVFVSSTLRNCRCGYLDFWADHRCLWIDVPLSIGLGHDLPPIVRPHMRRLKLQDPRIVDRYRKAYEKIVQRKKLVQRTQRLMAQATYPCPRELGEEFEKCDRIRIQAVLESERTCRKLHTGVYEYSPTFRKQELVVKFWTLRVRKYSRTVDSRYFIRLAKKTGLLAFLHTPLDEATTFLREAQDAMKSIKKNHKSLRDSFHYELAKAQADAGNEDISKRMKRNRQIEIQRRDARVIRLTNGKGRTGGLASVTAPDGSGVLKRFRQASDTPFMTHPLDDLVGALGVTDEARRILEGTCAIPPQVDAVTTKFITQLMTPKGVESTPLHRQTLEEHQLGWSKVREYTSSGPSRLHFGHMKANALYTNLAAVDYYLSNFPFETGYSPSRWQHGINVMLPKIAGNDFVGKLRAILLYEADFNHQNKQLGRAMMYNAEDLKLIATEQYGSRKHHQANDHGLNKVLTLDLARVRKTPLALCSNDAKSCYDRIVHAVACMCMQRVGVQEAPIVCMFTTIQNLHHYVRTIYGDSTAKFGGPLWITPVQGVGQGNGAGPQIWAIVSTPILNLLRAEGCGAFFRTALSGNEISFVGYSFVDDTDLCTASQDTQSSYLEVVNELQRALDLWSGGLRATGGALVPVKSYWYLIAFRWKPDGTWTYASIDETPASVQIPDHTGTRLTLERLDVKEARRTLGIRIAPDGNMQSQFNFMLQAAKEWAARITTGHLPRSVAWLSLTSTILRTLQYPLVATTLSEHQCDMIMAPVRKAALPAAGIVKTFPIQLATAAVGTQGLGLPNLYECQELCHIDRIIRFSSMPHVITGKLIRALAEQHKVEVGLNGSLMSWNFNEVGCLATPSWLTDTWRFVSSIDAEIRDDLPDFPLKRLGDRCLMEIFLQNRSFSNSELVKLNRCRIFLRIITLADITTGCGSKIQEADWNGIPDPQRQRHLEWPNQGRLPAAVWDLWRRALVSSLQLRGKILAIPLGRYFDSEKQCVWFFDPSLSRLYQRKGLGWEEYQKLPSRASRNGGIMKFRYPGTVTSDIDLTPSSLLRATVDVSRSVIRLTGYCSEVATVVQITPTSLDQSIAIQPASVAWALQRVRASDNGNIVADALRTGNCVGVSDGSFKDGRGAASWVIEGHDSEGRLTGLVNIPGDDSDQGAYRSELGGLFGLVTMVNLLCRLHHIETGTFKIMCDGKTALHRAITKDITFKTSEAQFDIIVAIRKAVIASPINFVPVHIKGHQDDDPSQKLDRFALLNIEMDRKAKEYLQALEGSNLLPNSIAGEPWAFWLKGSKVCGRLDTKLRNILATERGKAYWLRRNKFGTAAPNDVDWAATQAAMGRVPLSRRHWISKHASDMCASGKQMVRRGERRENKCPRCSYPEGALHIWQCPDPRARELWQASLSELEKWLISKHTAPDITKAICSNLSTWVTGAEPPNPATRNRSLVQTLQLQNSLGWRSFLEGRVVVGWASVQAAHFQLRGRRNTGHQWLVATICKLWDIAWSLWDQRNQILHHHTNSVFLQQLQRQIRQEFLQAHNLFLVDARRLFRPGLQKVLQYPPNQQKAWLERVVADRGRKARRFRTSRMAADRHAMAQWLRQANANANQPIPPP